MLFSVIIPMYNTVNYIGQCLDSILAQTFTDYEIIIVDDGSNDHSGSIADEYEAKYGCIKVIHKSNGGQSTARNEGLRNAKGEYVLFLDSDDFYVNTEAFSLIAQRCRLEPDIIAYKYIKFYESTNRYSACGYSYADINPSATYYQTLMAMIKKDAFFCSAWSKAIKKSILTEQHILFDEESRCEDMDWYYQVVITSKSIQVIDEVMIGYRQRDYSITASANIMTCKHFLAFFEKWIPKINIIQDDLLKCVLDNAAAKLYVNLLISYCSLRETSKREQYRHLKQYVSLLAYHENPKVKIVWMMYRIMGLKLLVTMLSVATKLR